ncbi:hypothetical protein [Streptomyces sp. PT12]|uniref:hypothetical protein n=1 Tax=Streptomyces sp. PT12 TaxID=1510197 RepID=UPI00215CEEC3|nr:hypothetical protein [Streptomyces sp. PT12]
MTGTPPTAVPEVGTMVRDTTRDTVGRVMAHLHGTLWLRPPGGGQEWTARPQDVLPLSASESLSSRVAELNRRARQPY